MDKDDMSCWLPALKPFVSFEQIEQENCRCPLSFTRPICGNSTEWVQVRLYRIVRLLAAGPAFELFNACNRHSHPDEHLLDPFLSRLAVVEGVNTRNLHMRILEYQIEGLLLQKNAVSEQWAEALVCWMNDLRRDQKINDEDE